MKILVTGGAGFIGSHLVDSLIAEGHEVVVQDNISTGKREWVNPKASFVAGDIRDYSTVENAIRGCSAVFHLAAQTDVRKSIEDPEYDYQVNVVGSKNVFAAAKWVGAKIVFASSAAIYGDKSPASEGDLPNPISVYGRNKLEAEMLCPDGSFIARLFNVCGPRGHGVVNTFCEAMLKGKELEIRGDGHQTRDFVHVSDVVNALVIGLNTNGTFNVGTGKAISILDVLHIIESVFAKKAKVRFVPPVEGDILHSVANIQKIRGLGWKPKLSSEEGVHETAKAILKT
jgi:UDP-glucose 4-epimerase